MSSLTTPDTLNRMVSEYVVALLDIPVPKDKLPYLFVKILPDNDYLEPPIAWASCLSKALGMLGDTGCSQEEYSRFVELLREALSSLGYRQKPVAIYDPYFKIIREKWESNNPTWSFREAEYQLHFIRPELRHPDFGDTVRGIRMAYSEQSGPDQTIQDLIDNFYEENPSSKEADQTIRTILEGKSLRSMKRLRDSSC